MVHIGLCEHLKHIIIVGQLSLVFLAALYVHLSVDMLIGVMAHQFDERRLFVDTRSRNFLCYREGNQSSHIHHDNTSLLLHKLLFRSPSDAKDAKQRKHSASNKRGQKAVMPVL